MRKFVYLVLLLTLAACQPGDTETSNSNSESSSGSAKAQSESKDVLEERPTVTFTYKGEEIETNKIRGCFVPDCSEDSATVERINHEEMTEGLESTQVEDGEAIQVHIDGKQPSQSHLSRYYETTIEGGTLEGSEITIHSASKDERKESFFVRLDWYNENQEFLGSLSKAFIVNVEGVPPK
ncbi:hypothetical protein CEH05_16180 [Halobacillus halophilus]|uniref:Lipoprotein n=1 Tax=Halobacillus halophilus (strain ATCC 35676 / DSM 2266 / JCM 20832 / KCTC 3685 / LMG 17431 / NBRC 102448 / NCIMB 2269) TaxID=866895 RepID=I0JR38_HALH3|nr:hypothetical protein [Halobacillus halophilus]ASF40608.1 hypothetical protein CEH05_16180 [Halobacillus halophilus]CCG46608.1 hypothetical protein HBHAL_4266 [Halobacillus halophilus DSM 2266]